MLRDLERRRRSAAQVIVFANEKGGVGKSTLAVHCAVALAHAGARVLAIDCDCRQQTLHRLFEARGGTARTLRIALPTPRYSVLHRQNGPMLMQEIERLGGDCDFVLIDLAGHDSPTARRAIAMADTVVTPINCSPADLDALGSINPVTGRFRHATPFTEVILALRDARLASGGSAFDWVVAKNRVRHCEHRLLALVNRNLGTMAERLGFRALAGLAERVGYRDLLPFGLTQLDLRFIPDIGAPCAQREGGSPRPRSCRRKLPPGAARVGSAGRGHHPSLTAAPPGQERGGQPQNSLRSSIENERPIGSTRNGW